MKELYKILTKIKKQTDPLVSQGNLDFDEIEELWEEAFVLIEEFNTSNPTNYTIPLDTIDEDNEEDSDDEQEEITELDF